MATSDAVFSGPVPEIYEQHLGPSLFEPYAQDMAARFAGFGGALLETAAGTGRVTRALARATQPSARIVATDLNEPMLAKAATLLQDPRVTWRQADAQALPFEAAEFDAVICQFGVMFFPDKAAGYAEARRVLRPGGRYVFSVWDALAENELSRAVHEAAAEVFPADPPGFLARTPYGHQDEAEIRNALAGAGFAAVTVERVAKTTQTPAAVDFAAGLCLGSPLRGELDARRPGEAEKVAAEVGARLQARFGPGPVEAKMQALVVTAAV